MADTFFRLVGKVAVVTGGGQGIGEAICRRLAGAGAKVGVFDLQSAMQQLEQTGIKLLIIDTPPAITDAISHVISLSDLILVPCRPSPHDLRSVGATADLADRHKKALIFIVNARSTERWRRSRSTTASISRRAWSMDAPSVRCSPIPPRRRKSTSSGSTSRIASRAW